jgi:hypothetical protein
MISGSEAKTGTIEGTGVALQVEVGFKPSYVKVLNYDDAGSLYSTLEWCSPMPAASGLKTKSIVDSGTTAGKSSELITSAGITQFAGEAPGKVLTGTLAATAADATISGTNTLFTTELKIGDVVKLFDGQEVTVLSITSATAFEATAAATASVTTNLATRITDRKEGFLIGAEGDINVSAETIYYLAIR